MIHCEPIEQLSKTAVPLHNYHRNNGRPRCALKIDIKKAYYTIGWSCVIDILSRLGTPANILKCIKACITTPSFSVAVNGELAGFFASKHGLRQGDPLSPLLFIIAMEAFSRSLYVAAQAPNFEFHPKCEGIKLTHVSFADDIFYLLEERLLVSESLWMS